MQASAPEVHRDQWLSPPSCGQSGYSRLDRSGIRDMVPGMARSFTFPNPVDEISARLVATGVVVMVSATLATGQWWILVPLVYGFVARVAAGPRFSPLG